MKSLSKLITETIWRVRRKIASEREEFFILKRRSDKVFQALSFFCGAGSFLLSYRLKYTFSRWETALSIS